MTFIMLHGVLAALLLHWTPQTTNTAAGLRGLCVVSHKVVWASGSKATVLRTLDGGQNWEIRKVAGAPRDRAFTGVAALDFRDIVAFDANNALVMSSGPGDASRVYMTRDGGTSWTLVLNNLDKTGFFDALKFWDRKHGILLGDPTAGHFVIYTTSDGGDSWVRGATLGRAPAAIAGEGAFAASGTCLTLRGSREAWFGTGGPGTARVFYTASRGGGWTVASTPMAGRTASGGIFSLVFLDSQHGVAVGGDYQKPAQTARTVALTSDGGFTWTEPVKGIIGGFRSAVTYVKPRKMLIAVGTSGSNYSFDGGATWPQFSTDNLNAVDNDGEQVWAAGPKGLIVKLALHK